MRVPLLLSACLVLCAAAGAKSLPRSYVCGFTSSPIAIDGKLDDAAWQKAAWTDYFTDIEGDKKPAPRFKTRVKMLWDDSCFYIGAELKEPHVWATIAKRDDVIFHDNDFEVFMDPDGDNFEYGEFEINALNTGWDLFLDKPYKDNGHADNEWNIEGIRTAVLVDGTLNNPADQDRGWSVEIAMPWASLERISHSPKAPQDGKQWRVNFSRVEWLTNIVDGKYKKIEGKPEDNWVWSPQAVINMHRPEMWGIVQFSRDAHAKVLQSPGFERVHTALHDVYYAEKEYLKQHQAYAEDPKALGLRDIPKSLQIKVDGSHFSASASWGPSGASGGCSATITEDSHFESLCWKVN